MGSVNAQTAYDYAVNQYSQARKLIAEVCQKAGRVRIFPTDDMLKHYDVVLQAILFRTSIADYKIYGNEKIFMETITDSMDLLFLINNLAGTKFTWDMLTNMSPEQLVEFNKALNSITSGVAALLVEPFACLDHLNKNEQAIHNLVSLTEDIVIALIAVDGDAAESADAKREKQIGNSGLIELLIEPWKKEMNRLGK